MENQTKEKSPAQSCTPVEKNSYSRKEWLAYMIYQVLRKYDTDHQGMTAKEIYQQLDEFSKYIPPEKRTDPERSTVQAYLDDPDLLTLVRAYYPGEIQEESELRSMRRALKENNSQNRLAWVEQVKSKKASDPSRMNLNGTDSHCHDRGTRYRLRGDLPDEVWRLVMDFLGDCSLLSREEAQRYQKAISKKYATHCSLPLGELPEREGVSGIWGIMAHLGGCVQKQCFVTLETRHRVIRGKKLAWAEGKTFSHVCVADIQLDEQQRPVALVLEKQDGRWEKQLLPVKQIAQVLPEQEALPTDWKDWAKGWACNAQKQGVNSKTPVVLDCPLNLLDQVEDICIRCRRCDVLETQGDRCLLRVHHASPQAVDYLIWKYPDIRVAENS